MDGLATTYGGLSLTQAAQAGTANYAVAATAGAWTSGDQSQSSDQASAQATASAAELTVGALNLTPASMSVLLEAQANISQHSTALVRRHTAEVLGQMIWSLDSAPPLSPAPLAVRRLRAAQSALNSSLVDLQA